MLKCTGKVWAFSAFSDLLLARKFRLIFEKSKVDERSIELQGAEWIARKARGVAWREMDFWLSIEYYNPESINNRTSIKRV
jgi:hypothetical protein